MYNREKAIEYAKKYAFNYNPNFYDFSLIGGDCTNFVSQCLFFGGIEMDYSFDGWFYSSANSRSPSWTSVEDLWNYGQKGKNLKIEEIEIGQISVGDIVQFYNKNQNRYYHCVIVTKIIEPIKLQNVFVTSHDNNAINKSLSLYNETNFRFGKIKN